MTATNHALTGALIATVVDKPLIALPLALASHFAIDMLPHFGYPGHGGYKAALKHRLSVIMMLADPILFVPLIIVLLAHNVPVWTYIAAFLALSPDLYDFFGYFVFKEPKGWNSFNRFASKIQWCEQPWGLVVEIVWYVGGIYLLINLLT